MSNSDDDSDAGCLVFALLGLGIFATVAAVIVGIAVVIAIIGGTTALVWGIIQGFTIPRRALLKRPFTDETVASPLAVQANTVMKSPPRGPSEVFGWDPAWPNYFPYQLTRDITAIREESARVRQETDYRINRIIEGDGEREAIIELGLLIALLPARVIFKAMVWFFVLVSIGIMWIGAKAIQLGQTIMSNNRKRQEAKDRARFDGDIHCTDCYASIEIPTYVCPGCSALHRDLSPGPLGLNERLCACGQILPVGILKASEQLRAICPHCGVDLPTGAGTRRLVTVPVFGSVSAGKTMFLSSLATRLQDSSNGFSAVPLNQHSEAFLTRALQNNSLGERPSKTEQVARPPGVSLLVNNDVAGQMEVHLLDSAGENFQSSEETKSLLYFDHAKTLVLVIDPLSITDVQHRLDPTQLEEHGAASQPPNGPYGAVVDRLRDGGMNREDKRLAVVVTKADVINSLNQFTPLTTNSDEIRDWLVQNGADDLIRRIDLDFETVQYFAVDSRSHSLADSRFGPVGVVDWIAGQGSDANNDTKKEMAND